MIARLFLFFLFFSHILPLRAQWVTIPDANFASRLQQLFPTCMNGNQMDTTCSAIVNATTLNVNNAVIYDLTGVQYFDSLHVLRCDSNYLSTLPPLPATLTHLYCNVNQITQLPPLPNSLTLLRATNNLLASLPLLPPSLTQLFCENNLLTSLPALPNTLLHLWVRDNQLTSLPNLSTSLYVLECSSNYLSNLPPLPGSLYSIYCSFNQLTFLPALPGTLGILWCNNNLLVSLSALPNTLYYLQCHWNQLTSLPVLPGSLTQLSCQWNQLTSMPAIPASLAYLDCSFNQITSLSAVPNVMNTFRIDHNDITCLINLPEITNGNGSSITYANISSNLLTCVPNQTLYSLGLPFCLDNDPIANPNNCPNVNITGHVFSDLNTNCVFDTTDLKTQNIPVKLYDSLNNFVAVSYTANGVYSFGSLNPDSFQVRIDVNSLPLAMDCGEPDNQSALLNAVSQSIFGVNFPVVCNQFDVAIQSVSQMGWVFPGQIHRLGTNITNNEEWYNLDCGSSLYSGTVEIVLPTLVNYLAPAPGAFTPMVNGDTLLYSVTDFTTLNPGSFDVLLRTDTMANSGDQFCVSVFINPNPVDGDTTNNAFEYCYNVLNSYDPNMKEVYPVNVLPGYDNWFTYTIHFQNTGTAPAFNIRLSDTLDAQLDLSTFEMLGYSHPAVVSLNGNILTVRFNNIMLPDSTTDYEGSMGYFQYRIKPLPNLPNGTQIENTAYIYFDYNAPIITNTTVNNFMLPVVIKEPMASDGKLSLFPNPGTGIFYFKDSRGVQSVEVYNLLGEKLLQLGAVNQINLQDQPKGIYLVRVNGTQMARVVKE